MFVVLFIRYLNYLSHVLLGGGSMCLQKDTLSPLFLTKTRVKPSEAPREYPSIIMKYLYDEDVSKIL